MNKFKKGDIVTVKNTHGRWKVLGRESDHYDTSAISLCYELLETTTFQHSYAKENVLRLADDELDRLYAY